MQANNATTYCLNLGVLNELGLMLVGIMFLELIALSSGRS